MWGWVQCLRTNQAGLIYMPWVLSGLEEFWRQPRIWGRFIWQFAGFASMPLVISWSLRVWWFEVRLYVKRTFNYCPEPHISDAGNLSNLQILFSRTNINTIKNSSQPCIRNTSADSHDAAFSQPQFCDSNHLDPRFSATHMHHVQARPRCQFFNADQS